MFLHLLFEEIWKYRFFYRDLNNLLANNRTLEIKFKELLKREGSSHSSLCEGLQARVNWTRPSRDSKRWQPTWSWSQPIGFRIHTCFVPRRSNEPAVVGAALQRGCYQAMALTAPYLTGAARRCSRDSPASIWSS